MKAVVALAVAVSCRVASEAEAQCVISLVPRDANAIHFAYCEVNRD